MLGNSPTVDGGLVVGAVADGAVVLARPPVVVLVVARPVVVVPPVVVGVVGRTIGVVVVGPDVEVEVDGAAGTAALDDLSLRWRTIALVIPTAKTAKISVNMVLRRLRCIPVEAYGATTTPLRHPQGSRDDQISEPAAAAMANTRPSPTNQAVISRGTFRKPIELPMSA